MDIVRYYSLQNITSLKFCNEKYEDIAVQNYDRE